MFEERKERDRVVQPQKAVEKTPMAFGISEMERHDQVFVPLCHEARQDLVPGLSSFWRRCRRLFCCQLPSPATLPSVLPGRHGTCTRHGKCIRHSAFWR